MEIIERVDDSGHSTQLYNHRFTRQEFKAERDKLSALREQYDQARREKGDHLADIILSRAAHEELKQVSDPERVEKLEEAIAEHEREIERLREQVRALRPDPQVLESSWRNHKNLITQKAEHARRVREARDAYQRQQDHFRIVQNTVNRTGLS